MRGGNEVDRGKALLDDPSRSSKILIARPYNDVFFSLAFMAQLLTVVGLGFSMGISALKARGPSFVTVNDKNTQNVDSSGQSASMNFFGGVFFIVFISGFLSVAWVALMTYLSHQLISFTFTAIIVLTVVVGIILFTSGTVLLGLCLMLIGLGSCLLFIYLRPRIAFASTTLKIACESIKDMPSTLLFSVVALGMQILYCVLWTMAVLGTATNESQSTLSANGQTYKLSQCSTYSYSTVREHIWSHFIRICVVWLFTTGVCNSSTEYRSEWPAISLRWRKAMHILCVRQRFDIEQSLLHCSIQWGHLLRAAA